MKLLACLLLSTALFAQRHELGLTLGRLYGPERSSPAGNLQLGGGIAFQANYGYRLYQFRHAALFGEVHFLANPLREIRSINTDATRDVATLYATPGIRVKFLSTARIQPYGVIGGGYALYEQSHFRISGADNLAPRFTHRGAFTYGGGVDVQVLKWISARGEVRNFYTGNPSFNAPVRNGQNNVVVSGGFVLNWGRADE